MNNLFKYPILFSILFCMVWALLYFFKHREFAKQNNLTGSERIDNIMWGAFWFLLFLSEMPAFIYRVDAYFIHVLRVTESLLSLTWWDRFGKYVAYFVLTLKSNSFFEKRHPKWIVKLFEHH